MPWQSVHQPETYPDGGLSRHPADDTLTGTNDADRIEGGAGDDTLSGLGGDDILIGGSGINVIDGGGGFDIVDYSDRATGITLLLNYPADKMPQSAGREGIVDVLTSIEVSSARPLTTFSGHTEREMAHSGAATATTF